MSPSRRVFFTAFTGLLIAVLQLAAEPPEEKSPAKEESPGERAGRIVKTAGSVAKNLAEKDAGDATRERQAQILRDLDELLKLPPSPPMNSSSSNSSNSPKSSDSPMGGASKQSSPMGGSKQSSPMGGEAKSSPPSGGKSSSGSSEGMSRREKRAQQQGQQQAKGDPKGGSRPMPMNSGGKEAMAKGEPKGGSQQANNPMPPMGGPPMQPMGLANDDPMPPPSNKPNRIADLGRGIWGHLPDTLRQELDLYYRDQFMPRHGDLLREYYSNIAEGDRPRNR